MKIDHIGYAVKRIDRAQKAFENLGFVFEPVIEDTDRNISLAFAEKDSYRIELVCPLDKKKESPVDSYLSKIGPVPYHFCYISDDLEADVDKLQKEGCRVVIEPRPAVAFGGRRVVFLMNLGFGLMEIVEAQSGIRKDGNQISSS